MTTTSQGELARAICKVMAAVRYVPETGKNTFHGYSYASDEDLLAVLQPAMADAGLAMIPAKVETRTVEHTKDRKGKEQYRTELVVTYELLHVSGETRQVQAPGCGIDGEDKGVYKAMTGALKYALRHTFLVPTGQDAERDTRKPERDEEEPKPRTKTKESPKKEQPKADPQPAEARVDPVDIDDRVKVLQAVVDELVGAGWARETIKTDVADFARFVGLQDSPWDVKTERLPNLPGWVEKNHQIVTRWRAWWKAMDQLLHSVGRTRDELVAFQASLSRSDPRGLAEEERNKLLVWMRDAGGLDRLVTFASKSKKEKAA